MQDYLTSILGVDPLPRGTRLTYVGIWKVTAWHEGRKIMTLLLAHDRIQSPDEAEMVAQHSFSKLAWLKDRDKATVEFEATP